MTERRRGFSLRDQLRNFTPLLVLWFFGSLGIAIAALQTEASLEVLFLDAAYVTGSPWYAGLLSNLGILGWTVAATAALGGAWVAKHTGRPSAATFLLLGAVATAVLLFDDMLQVHSDWLPSIGVPKLFAQLLVVLPAVMWLLVFHQELARTRWLLIAGALASFVVSLGVDSGLGLTGTTSLLVEDGGKFLGVLAWAQYFALTAKEIARSTIDAATGRAAASGTPAVESLQETETESVGVA